MQDEEKFNPDEREPCPDDLCTGIIGPDGRCGTCGRQRNEKPAEGEEKKDVTVVADSDETAESQFTSKFDENERIPCKDDLCTGIIGPDGKCGVCGKPYNL